MIITQVHYEHKGWSVIAKHNEPSIANGTVTVFLIYRPDGELHECIRAVDTHIDWVEEKIELAMLMYG